jgi:hypothetical protein
MMYEYECTANLTAPLQIRDSAPPPPAPTICTAKTNIMDGFRHTKDSS